VEKGKIKITAVQQQIMPEIFIFASSIKDPFPAPAFYSPNILHEEIPYPLLFAFGSSGGRKCPSLQQI